VTNPFNKFVNKQQVLVMITTGTLAFSSFERQIEYVRVYGDTVIVAGSETVTWAGRMPNAGQITHLRITSIWMKQGGRWQQVARHANIIPQQSNVPDDSSVRPPITNADLEIVKRAQRILGSPSKWNRADNRECPAGAKTFSLYCALQTATKEVAGKSEHRGAALQEARFVIDEIAADRDYNHRLMDYNNDPTTTFADIQEVFRISESLIALRLKANSGKR